MRWICLSLMGCLPMLSVLAHPAHAQSSLRLAPYAAITNDKITPAWAPPDDAVGRPVRVRLARNEIESAAFAIVTSAPLDNLIVRVHGQSASPAIRIDVHWVLYWYQCGDQNIYRAKNPTVLTPELLVRNPGLVALDHTSQRNRVVASPKAPPRTHKFFAVADDAVDLQPLSLPADFAQLVWLTIDASAEAQAGEHEYVIEVVQGDRTLASLPMQIDVLDFDLREPIITYSLYSVPQLGHEHHDRQDVELTNLRRHGITHPLVRARDEAGVQGYLQAMKRHGFAVKDVFIFGFDEQFRIHFDAKTPQALGEVASRWVSAARSLGAERVYLYMIDEAKGEQLLAQRPYVEAIRDAGGLTFSAVDLDLEQMEQAMDLFDAMNVAFAPAPRHAVEQLHQRGIRIFCYGNPQGGLELPETYRRNYGLLLWQARYDGAMNFAHWWPFGDPWDDFDHDKYKDHNLAYPTRHGLIDTIQWAGWREAADDCRYVATLEHWIAQAQGSAQAQRAEQWLSRLRDAGPDALADLDDVRRQIIEQIQACRLATPSAP